MPIYGSLREHLETMQDRCPYSCKLLLEALEHQATGKDAESNHRLLKELVLKYSSVERKLVELNELKNKFLGMAAHDLRSPLSSIRGLSEVLLTGSFGPLAGEQKEFLGIIKTTAESMLNLVNNLLDVAVIENGRLELEMKRGALKSLISERVRIHKLIAEKKSIAIGATCADVPDALFDPGRISQVMDNLISNAVKFSPPGSKVHVGLWKEQRMARVSVRDEGPGIAPEDRAKLFGEFQKLSSRPTGGEKCTGLGLAIVKKIVEAHGGSLDVKTQLGSGSTFSFTVPLAG
jgi:two-component system sensor histidine kinase/response regulator